MPKPNGNRTNSKERNGYDRRRQKNPFEQRFKSPSKVLGPKIPKSVRRQKFLHKQMKQIARELKLVPAKEMGTGVDYYFRFVAKGKQVKIPIDFKFSFGEHFGDEYMKVRVTPKNNGGKRQVINESKWTIAADAEGSAVIFRTAALQDYISKFTGRIKKEHQIEKLGYVEWPINVSDMLYHTQTGVIQTKLNPNSIKSALLKIRDIEAAKITPKPKLTHPERKGPKKTKIITKTNQKIPTKKIFRKGNRNQ